MHFGDTGRHIYVTFTDDLGRFYGENSPMKMIEAKNMGERMKQLDEMFGKVVARWTHYDASYRADLTYWPMPEGATN